METPVQQLLQHLLAACNRCDEAPPPGAGGYGAAPAEKGGKGMSPYGGKGGPVHVPPPAQWLGLI